MALFNVEFRSEVLGLIVGMKLIIPEKRPDPTATLPVLYLLHGLSDDNGAWSRQTSIERYVEPYDLMVVMPEVGRSFYADMRRGLKYWSFISEELPQILRNWFPQMGGRDETYVAGLSMGGYGAMKLALSFPDRFAYAATLSGAVDMKQSYRSAEELARFRETDDVFGSLEDFTGSPNDLLQVAEQLSKRYPRSAWPKVYQYCGTEDFLYSQNATFHQRLNELSFNLTYEEGPGDHQWKYWDEKIQTVLRWLPLRTREPV